MSAAGAATLVTWLTAPRAGVEQSAAAPTTATAPGADFAWLTKAMEACDAEAAKAEGEIEFLVIPLKSAARDPQEWRRKSLNDIGNAILIAADDAVEGLKNAALSISEERYVFSIRDEATNVIYKWSQSVGVKKFISADVETIERFKVRFELDGAAGNDNWGAGFVRHRGNCYWVNAVLGNF
jgi:hypothetical protein